MRSRTANDLGGRCARCYLPGEPCLCAELPLLRPHVELVVIRHMLERKKSTNSARWAVAALAGAQVHEWGMPQAPLDVAALVVPGSWVLFPNARATPPPQIAPRRLIVVDGTWPQARRMLQRIPALRNLPRLSLAAPPPRPRLRAESVDAGMTTMEAIAGAYAQLGEAEVAVALEKLYLSAVARSQKIRGRRTM
jgi:DTW domain-containing protein